MHESCVLSSLGVPQDALLPLTKADERKLNHIKKRPYISYHPAWEREVKPVKHSSAYIFGQYSSKSIA